MKTQFTIGLDLGGTKLAAGLLDGKGRILDFVKIPVELQKEGSAGRTQKRVLSLMTDITCDFHKRFPKECSARYFKGVGLASAGPLNTLTGQLIHPVNFPGWKIYPIRENLQKELKKQKFLSPVVFQNDAIAAALAESWVGAARGLETFAVVTVGTGVGSGVIVHGRPCHTLGMGSEFGHTLMDFQAIKKHPELRAHHTVEGLASGTGLLRRAREMGFEGQSVEELVLKMQSESQYHELFDDMAWALAGLCYNLSIGFHVQKILFSGGLLKIADLFFPQMKKHYDVLINNFNRSFNAPIAIAKGGNKAGVIGAGYLPYLEMVAQ